MKQPEQLATIPTSPEDKKKLKGFLSEASICLEKIKDQRDALKDIADVAKEEFGMKPKIFNKLAKTMHKHDYADQQAENEEFELLYETLVEGKTTQEE
jgi:hypothetical protein